jgi:hypothetical protein
MVTMATGDRVRVRGGAYRARRGTVALAAFAPHCVLVELDGCPVPLAFGGSELEILSARRRRPRGKGPGDVDPASIAR